MRKSNIVLAVILGATILSGCSALNSMVKLAENQQIDVVPSPLELHGDSVKYDMSVVLPAKMLPENYVYNLASYYKYGESEVEVGKTDFAATDFPDSKTTTSRKTETLSFLYDESMSQGDLQVVGTAIDTRKGKSKSTARISIAQGVITTSQLVQDVFYAAYAGSGYNDQEELIPTNVNLYFDRGSAVLKRSETRSSKGKEFSAFIADKNVTKTVTITGTHSPEGLETVNSKLSENRAKAIETYYRSQMRKYDYMDMAESIEFIIKPVIEDWTEFKDALNAYDGVSDTQKSEIVKIVNGGGTFEDKEKALQKLNSYSAIFKDIYPGLRAARTEVLTVKKKKTNAEIAIIAKQIAENDSELTDSLSIEELLFAGTLTPSLTEKEGIYKAATKQEGNWQSHNNLGAVYLEMAIAAEGSKRNQNVESAITQLEIAAKKNNTAEVQANMATAYALQGNAAQAYDAAVAAMSSNPGSHAGGIKGVKGALEIKMAKYSDAVSSLSSADETSKVAFNKGLALLLSKDFDNAATAFGSSIELDKEFALAYYAQAVTSARLGNQADVVNALKMAIEKDPALKEKALKDLEFRSSATQVAEALK